ncbi:bifunctional phosphoglucose/phosphomannose isomerase [Candidatus Bipolaricaulota bacterium]|nr:bifunctional phosphoglucose/phosphomannose isomerase [Candidatus Bipolaricaulota bacterium]
MILNDTLKMKEMDPQGMLEDLDGFPEQCQEAVSIGRELDVPLDISQYDRLIVTGMGGSAIAGNLLERLVDLPVITNRGYKLPNYVTGDDLLLGISYSGNTEETLAALEDGISRGMKAACLTTGGKMERLCNREAVPLIKIPTGHQPRASTGYILFPLLELLREEGLAGTLDLDGLIDDLTEMREAWGSEVGLEDNASKRLAEEFDGKVPIIYGTKYNTEAVAYRWKTQVNENAKQPAFWNVFPELNHNETVGYEMTDTLMENGKALILTNGFDSSRNEKRMRIIQEIFEGEGIPFAKNVAPQGDKFTEILGQVYFGDYFSVYLALLNGSDPSPVRLIEDFKKKLKE